MRRLAFAFVCAFAATAAPASAAVTTTCAMATSCTLAELLLGNSITVDGVVFDGFNFNPGDDFGTIPVDPSLVTVTGVSGADQAALDFVFDPALMVAGADDFIAYLFSFAASGMVDFLSAGLSFVDDQLAITDDAQSIVNASLSNAAILEIFADSMLGTQSSDMAAAAGSSLSGDFQLSLSGFNMDAGARLAGFRYLINYESAAPEVPLPAAAPLFLSALIAAGAARRRPKTK